MAWSAEADGQMPSLLKVRRWLKMLMDRSLVLGTIDRPQLHDIVRDFNIGQHTPDELREAQRRLVHRFRINRPANVHGIKRWNNALGDATGKYIRYNSTHHVVEGCSRLDGSQEASDRWMREILDDAPADDVVMAAANVVGAATLSAWATKATEGGHHWRAGMLHFISGNELHKTEGMGQAAVSWRAALDSFSVMPSGGPGDIGGRAHELFGKRKSADFPRLWAEMNTMLALLGLIEPSDFGRMERIDFLVKHTELPAICPW